MTAPPADDCFHRTGCRVCGHNELERVLQLGPTPLANSFLRSESEFADERSYPLDLYVCHHCRLLQLLDVVNPDVLFRHYLYVTGTSTTMAEHNREYARTLCDRLSLGSEDLVIEIASNDGSLLKNFRAHGVKTLGIEPARNLAAVASAAGIPTINEFFDATLAESLKSDYPPARVVVANNVLAHVDDPLGFLDGCRRLVSENGVITIEVPYVRELLNRLEYDTVYHEHLSYFSVTSLLRLCEQVGLSVAHVDHQRVHGGSLRLYLSKASRAHSADALALEAEEHSPGGAADLVRHRRFAHDVERHRTTLVTLLERLKTAGSRVAGYGAPAKGNTLLNYCQIDTRLLPMTVDKNPLKVGLFTPGMHIPVRDVSALADEPPPDYVLILAWNFAEEVMEQQKAHRRHGGRFIVPIPEPAVV